ncbi:MAG: alpha-L-fucosidase [Armatimonadota bacterium]
MRPTTRLVFVVLALGAVGPLSVSSATADSDRDRTQWWREAKFGMFVHWGVYALLGRGEWVMYREKIPIPVYEKLQPQFRPLRFDENEWVELAQSAGMRYITFTSKHHDGFCMFDSKLTHYSSMYAPCRKDFVRLLTRACHQRGMKIQYYYSLLDWHHPDYKTNLPRYVEYAHGQVRELCTNYGKIDGIWFDGGWEHSAEEWKSRKLHHMIRQLQPHALINNRARYDGDYTTPEQKVPGAPMDQLWETCMTINNSWGHNARDRNFKSARQLVQTLVDVVSKGGNFLLNVGPLPDGRIPEEQAYRLRQVGAWMQRNGESIYGTTGSPFRETPWGRCTAKGDRLYIHLFEWPTEPVRISRLLTRAERAWLLDGGQEVLVRNEPAQVVLKMPPVAPDPYDTVVVVQLAGPPTVDYAIRPETDGSVLLRAVEAQVHGDSARYESKYDNIGFWTNRSDWVSWEFVTDEPGHYTVEITYACERGVGGSEYTVSVGEDSVKGKVRETGTWGDMKTQRLGRMKLPPGRHTLAVKPLSMPGYAVMNLRQIRLVPVG